MIAHIIFWLFQVLTLPSALAMVFATRKFHESMMKEPERAYKEIGFSPTAVEMVHNVIRGQGAALLAISFFLLYTGPHQKETFLLISIASFLTLISHIMTARHHMQSETVMKALGNDLRPMYFLLFVNAVMTVSASMVFYGLHKA